MKKVAEETGLYKLRKKCRPRSLLSISHPTQDTESSQAQRTNLPTMPRTLKTHFRRKGKVLTVFFDLSNAFDKVRKE